MDSKSHFKNNTNTNGNATNGNATNGNATNGNATIRYPGITSPINTNAPKASEIALTEQLEACLRSFDLFETEEEMNHRMQILSEVNELFKKFVQLVTEQKKMPVDVATQINGKIFTFGSFRLGVHTRGTF